MNINSKLINKRGISSVYIILGILIIFAITAVLVISAGNKKSKNIVKVYSDNFSHIHVVYANGEDIRVTNSGSFTDSKLAEDKRTVGWLDYVDIGDPKWNVPPDTWVSQKLFIWKDGKIISTIEPGGFVRGWRFWKNGKQVAIYVGGLHFAGSYELYDISSKKLIESIEELKGKPEWTNGL